MVHRTRRSKERGPTSSSRARPKQRPAIRTRHRWPTRAPISWPTHHPAGPHRSFGLLGRDTEWPDDIRTVNVRDVPVVDLLHLRPEPSHLRPRHGLVVVPAEDGGFGGQDPAVVAPHRGPRARRPGIVGGVGEGNVRVLYAPVMESPVAAIEFGYPVRSGVAWTEVPECRARIVTSATLLVPSLMSPALRRLRERRRAYNLLELCVEPGGSRIGEARQRLITVLVDEPS